MWIVVGMIVSFVTIKIIFSINNKISLSSKNNTENKVEISNSNQLDMEQANKKQTDMKIPTINYTDIVDLSPYHLSSNIRDELNNMYQRYLKLTAKDKDSKSNIILLLPVHFVEVQKRWSEYLPDICILWEFDDESIVGYFYRGICEGMLIAIDPVNHAVIGVFRNYNSFKSVFGNLSRSLFLDIRSGNYPEANVNSDMQEMDYTLALQLCSMLDSQSNYLTKRMLACMVTKIMPYQGLGQLENWTYFPDPYVQVSLFRTLRYYKYKDASVWMKLLLQQEEMTVEVQSEAELTYDMLCYPGTFEHSVTARGEYKKFSNRTQYGDVIIRYEPIEGEQLQFAVEEGQSDVPAEFYYAIEFGIAEAIKNYRGFRLIGIRAVLAGGSTDPESNEMAYKIAAYLSFKKALEDAVVIPVKGPEGLRW